MNEKRLRVLLVDDDTNLREPLVEFLSQTNDFHVDAAAAEQAIHLVLTSEQPYHVALIDDFLIPVGGEKPIRSGIELMGQIKTLSPRTETIIFTGWGMDRALEALRAGAFRYLLKPFNDEELAILIHHAAQQRAEKEKLDRVIACSPNGIVAIDTRGKIILFNERAQEILGYPREEVEGEEIRLLYLKEDEAQRIGQLLKTAPNHTLRGEKTELTTKDGRPVSILLSATYWYDANGLRLGSIGYFENLTEIQRKDEQLALLSKASAVMAQAESITVGLEALAELLVKHLNRTSCSIFLLNETGSILTVKAAYAHQEIVQSADQSQGSEYRLKIFGCPVLQKLFSTNQHQIVTYNDPGRQSELERFSRHLQLNRPLRSLLLIPLIKEGQIVGMLSLGEMRSELHHPFTADESNLATTVAHQITGLIDRLRQIEITDYRGRLLDKLNKALYYIQGGLQISKLQEEIAEQAAKLLGYERSYLFTSHAQRGELELCRSYPDNSTPRFKLSREKGLIGRAIREGKPQSKQNYDEWAERESVFNQYRFKTVIAVPLKPGDEIEYVLVAADQVVRPFVEIDEEMLERLGSRASLTLQNAQLASQKQRVLQRLSILQHVAFYTQKVLGAENLNGPVRLERLLHVTLTGVTAGYGLGFNRAAIFLLDERGESLIGQGGIGQFDWGSADAVWREAPAPQIDDFFTYIALLEQGNLVETPVGAAIRRLRLPIGSAPPTIFSEILEGGYSQGVIIQNEQLADLPIQFLAAFAPESALAVVPLVVRSQVIGLLVADNKFTQMQIDDDDLTSLLTFVNATAVVLENHRLFQQKEDAHIRQQRLSLACDQLAALQEPEQLLRHIVDLTVRATGAGAASLILIDEKDQPRRVIPSEIAHRLELSQVARPDGVSLEVMRTGKAVPIPDLEHGPYRANPLLIENQLKAAVCLPFSAQGRKHGVLWIAYDHPHNFSNYELKALQLYVNQAAGAYDNARRMEDLKHLREAAEALATTSDVHIIQHQIAELALEVLQADLAVIWSFDSVHERFYVDDSVVVGAKSREVWPKLQQMTPRDGGTAMTVLKERWLGVEDIYDQANYPFLSEPVRNLLGEIGVRAYQGIALMVGDEPFGVLYVDYNRRRQFSQEEREIAQAFANHAALVLRRAKMIKLLKDTQNTATAIARVTTLGDLDTTLKRIALGTKETTGCEPIMLFVYDQERDKFRFPPTMLGVEDIAMASLHPVATDSVVYQIMKHGRPVTARDISTDPRFKDTDFVRRERTKSCLAVPLQIGDQSVGVLFVNDRDYHNFTENEEKNIELFANQAAIAISNTRLYQEVHRRADALQTLHEAGNEISGSLDEREIIDKIIRQVWKLAGKEGSFATVRKIVDHAAHLAAYYPAPPQCDHPIELNPGAGQPRGISGRAVSSKQPQLVGDVRRDPDYIEYYSATRAELIVPIIIDDKVAYLIDLEHPEVNAFDDEDRRVLELLANQAGIAIQNARKYESLIEAKVQIEASTELSWMDMLSGMWRHEIESKALTIEAEVGEILDGPHRHQLAKDQVERLAKIGEMTKKIRGYKITPPVSSEDGVTVVSVNDLLTERFRTIVENDPSSKIKYQLCLSNNDSMEIRISPDWLRIACDLLIDNAVRAMKDASRKEISINTSRNNGLIEITVADTGKGISPRIQGKLFKGIISKEDGGEGLGGGLLKAQAIIKKYGGEIDVAWTETAGETTGTRMTIKLPAVKLD